MSPVSNIPSENEDQEARHQLRQLLERGAALRDKGKASVALVVGNGLSLISLESVKQRVARLSRMLSRRRRGTRFPPRTLDAFFSEAWMRLEQVRIESWNQLPSGLSGNALVLMLAHEGITRLVFSSNYDLFLESLLLRFPHTGSGLGPPTLLINPVLEGPEDDNAAGLRRQRCSDPLLVDSPIRLHKYNGTTSHALVVSDLRQLAARLGQEQVKPTRTGRNTNLSNAEIKRRFADQLSFSEPKETFDLRRGPFGRIGHCVDWLWPSHQFVLDQQGCRRAFSQHRDELSGLIVLGNAGLRGEALNRQLCEFAQERSVVQVLLWPPYEPAVKSAKPMVAPAGSLWEALADLEHGYRLLLTRHFFETTDAGSWRQPLPSVLEARAHEIRSLGDFAGRGLADCATIENRLKASGIWSRPGRSHDIAEGYEALVSVLTEGDQQ